MPLEQRPSVSLEYKRFPLAEFAPTHILCPDEEQEELLFIRLHRTWREDPLIMFTQAPVVLALDFTGISRIRFTTVQDSLAAFISIVKGPNYPFYVVFQNLADKERMLYDLHSALQNTGVVVAAQIKDGATDLIGEKNLVNKYRQSWIEFHNQADDKWYSSPELRKIWGFPRNFANQMHRDGILVKDAGNAPFYHPLLDRQGRLF